MEDLLNGCCNPSGVVGDWLLTVPQLPDVTQADYKHAYILPDDTVWVLNSAGDAFVQLNGGSGGGSNVTFVDNGDGTGTITINGVPNTVITEDNVGLEIGARNILRGTANPALVTSTSEGTWVNGKFYFFAAGGTVENVTIPDSPAPSVNKGIRLYRGGVGTIATTQLGVYLQRGNYTISFWYRGTVGTVVSAIAVRQDGTTIGQTEKLFTIQSPSWTKFKYTYNAQYDANAEICRIELRSTTIGQEITILAPQVERSNIASDWRPAPEDYVSIGGGITEAPIDGKLYGRKDGAWVEIVIPAAATLTVNSVEEHLENISVEDL